MYDLQSVEVILGGNQILRDIDLFVREGEFVALVGPNGAGKSTLLSVLSGDVPVAAGVAYFEGRPIADWSLEERARHRAVLTQSGIASFAYTVEEVVEMGCRPRGRKRTRDEVGRVITEALRDMEVDHLRRRSYTTLSGGEARRVDMARVIAQQTPSIFLDEPTNHLDPRHQMSLLTWCRQYADAGGTVIGALHDLNYASMFADRVVLLHGGTILRTGQAQDIFDPELLQQAYGLTCQVTRHPSGCPWVIPEMPEIPMTDVDAVLRPLFRTEFFPKTPSHKGA